MQSLIYERYIDRVLEPDHFLHKFFCSPSSYQSNYSISNAKWLYKLICATIFVNGTSRKSRQCAITNESLITSARAWVTNRPSVRVHLWPSSLSSFVEVQEKKSVKEKRICCIPRGSDFIEAIEEIGITSIRKSRNCNNMEEFVDQLIRPFTILLSDYSPRSILLRIPVKLRHQIDCISSAVSI